MHASTTLDALRARRWRILVDMDPGPNLTDSVLLGITESTSMGLECPADCEHVGKGSTLEEALAAALGTNPAFADLLPVTVPRALAPALTIEQMIAYLQGRGWTVKRESRSRWAYGYYCYKLRMEGNRERHDDGSSLKVAFLQQIMADTNAVFAALDAS